MSRIRDIESENQKIKAKIEQAKSNYSVKAFSKHINRLTKQKEILMSGSPSRQNLDPLVTKLQKVKFSNRVSNFVNSILSKLASVFRFNRRKAW